ncbi:MAG: mycofactocin radical SAM maturase [Acidimicrobiales bacterium]
MSIQPDLKELLGGGLRAPICLTWELTYACNLACTHCLSSSGRRDPRELDTAACIRFIDELAAMGVFYVNIGGGEPTSRADFEEIVAYALSRRVGIKYSTNGLRMSDDMIAMLAANDYLDLQISLDGPNPSSNDPIRGEGTFERVLGTLERLHRARVEGYKISTVVTRRSLPELDDLLSLATGFGATLRLTRLRPSGRGALSWEALRLQPEQQRILHQWLLSHPEVLTGDSYFHLNAFGAALPGLNMCGAGRVVCLVDPIGTVYACPFTIAEEFAAGTLSTSSFQQIWNESPLFAQLRHQPGPTSCTSCAAYAACQGGCMAQKYFTGLSYDDPDPECVFGHGSEVLSKVTTPRAPDLSHSVVRFGPRRSATSAH